MTSIVLAATFFDSNEEFCWRKYFIEVLYVET